MHSLAPEEPVIGVQRSCSIVGPQAEDLYCYKGQLSANWIEGVSAAPSDDGLLAQCLNLPEAGDGNPGLGVAEA